MYELRVVGAGRVERGIGVGLGTAAIADTGHCHALLATQFERQRGTCGMQALGTDRHAEREILARHLEIAAALVATPVHQHFAWAHAAHELRAILAVTGCEYIRSEEHTSELQSLMRISYAVYC